MESRKLEITLHSAKGLHDVKFFGTMDPYAIVWIAGDGKESVRRTTVVSIKGGSSPIWNCPMRFDVTDMHKNYTLFCEIKHDGKLFDRGIGEVQVPFADLLAGNGSGERLSYPVKLHSGDGCGDIILSHKFTEKNGKEYVDGGSRKKVRRKKKNGGKVKKIARVVATGLAVKVVMSVAAVALSGGAIAFGVEDLLNHDGDGYEDDGEEDDGEEDEYEDDEYEDEDEDES